MTAREYGPPPRFGVHAEGSGYVATCECRWERWWVDQKPAATEYARRQEKCKGAPVEVARPAPKPRAKSDWSGREGSTWIDKL